MGNSDRPRPAAEDDGEEHPLKEGLDAAREGETASLEDILSEPD